MSYIKLMSWGKLISRIFCEIPVNSILSLLQIFRSRFRQMTNSNKTIQVNSNYTITKVDLYLSARKNVTFHIWRSFNSQQIIINNHYDTFCDTFLIKIFCNLNLSWISKTQVCVELAMSEPQILKNFVKTEYSIKICRIINQNFVNSFAFCILVENSAWKILIKFFVYWW